jgi:radical SAM protein with 4Fe4S-binding SPASM domain
MLQELPVLPSPAPPATKACASTSKGSFASRNPVKKLLFNLLKARKERFPELLTIELTNVCNADCIMCPRGTMDRRIQHMPFEVLEKIIKDCKNKPIKKMNLFWMGDSPCHPKFVDYLRYVRKQLPGVKLYLSTNAGLLFEEKSRAIIDEQLLDVINFDIDGMTKETYEAVRLDVNFDDVMKHTHFFIQYRNEKNTKKPQIRTTIIKMKPTAAEVDDFVKYWKPRVDRVDVNRYNTWLGRFDDLNVGDNLKNSREGYFDFACQHPWNELTIGADGRVSLCCLDYELSTQVGDVKTESISDIWKGPALRNYRNAMQQDRYQDIDICRNCNAYIYQTDKLWARLQR